MNVIVSNKYQALLSNLDIDIIKSVNGVFTVDELVAQFANFFYNKMIIDITAIDGYEDIGVIQNLSVSFDMTKIILLLDDSVKVNSPVYLSQLVSMGIYNFTMDIDSIKFLLVNPNTYKDVAQFHNLSGFKSPKLNETAVDVTKGKIGRRVLGFKNVTEHAGSTTLVYLLKLHLEKYYKVKAVEVDGQDFVFFNDPSLDYVTNMELGRYLAENGEVDVVLVDINGGHVETLCDEIIYLIEPGLVKLNKLIRQNGRVFDDLRDKRIVLNRSVLDAKDVQDFEKESGSRVFYNIPCIDDKLDNQAVLNQFLSALGFSRVDDGDGKGLFSIFK